jgi:membrane protease YdiL (CAAX protease family)
MTNPNRSSSILDFFSIPRESNLAPLIYLQFITLAEILTTLRVQAHSIGLVMHSIILSILLIHGAMEDNIRYRRIYLTIALAPLMRVLSLTLPLAMAGLALEWWYFWIGLLVYVAMFVAAIITRIPARRVGLRVGKLRIQLLIGLIGIPLGLWEYFILRPTPLTSELDLEAMLLPMLILVIFTGVLEEALFRGLIQQTVIAAYGKFGITFSAILFAVLHIGYGSIADVLFVFGVAILFGLITHRTDSILGVSMAHGLTNIGLLLVFPHLVGDLTFMQVFDYVLRWLGF